MKNVLLLLGLFFFTVADDDIAPLMSSLIKSFNKCIQKNSYDQETVTLVSKHKGKDNKEANCLRGCILLESELVNGNGVFNTEKLNELVVANGILKTWQVEICMKMADLCIKKAKGVKDTCKLAEKYFNCFLTIKEL